MHRVLTLDPAIFPIAPVMSLIMRGTISQGATVQSVPYPNLYVWKGKIVTAAEAVAIGAEETDKAIHGLASEDTATLFGYSMGSQVLCKWLRDYGPLSPIEPSRIKFLLIANPEFTWTSRYFASDPGMDLPDNGGVGIPNNTKYTCVDFARQYDGMADYPNKPMNSTARKNAAAGQSDTHNNYWDVTLNDPTNVWKTEGNVSRVMSPTWPLPMVSGDWFMNIFKTAYDNKLRPEVEACYDRSYLPLA